jgi:hypothetical protein
VWRVLDVQALEPYRVRVAFDDGVVREVDCSFLLRGTLGEPLHDPAYFGQVRVDPESPTIVWPNGLDSAPGRLHDPERRTQLAEGSPPRAA